MSIVDEYYESGEQKFYFTRFLFNNIINVANSSRVTKKICFLCVSCVNCGYYFCCIPNIFQAKPLLKNIYFFLLLITIFQISSTWMIMISNNEYWQLKQFNYGGETRQQQSGNTPSSVLVFLDPDSWLFRLGNFERTN